MNLGVHPNAVAERGNFSFSGMVSRVRKICSILWNLIGQAEPQRYH